MCLQASSFRQSIDGASARSWPKWATAYMPYGSCLSDLRPQVLPSPELWSSTHSAWSPRTQNDKGWRGSRTGSYWAWWSPWLVRLSAWHGKSRRVKVQICWCQLPTEARIDLGRSGWYASGARHPYVVAQVPQRIAFEREAWNDRRGHLEGATSNGSLAWHSESWSFECLARAAQAIN